MNTYEVPCPVCKNTNGGSCKKHYVGDNNFNERFICKLCGKYELEAGLELPNLEPIQQAILSHKICTASREEADESKWFRITYDLLNTLESQRLPNPKVQAANMIRYIGDEVSRLGNAIKKLPMNFHTTIGAFDHECVRSLVYELEQNCIIKIAKIVRGTAAEEIRGTTAEKKGLPPTLPFGGLDLTLSGWEQYEEEKRGRFDGNYGFLAMKFGNADLDAFVKKVLKPTVKEKIGYELVDMNDRPEAGIIDNIMRIRIRDAKFVIADLTHDNNGAYWEAGYAEGLGKPVIYICNKKKFENDGTHFDANHCTTVFWSKVNNEDFCKDLIATLRRSLDEAL